MDLRIVQESSNELLGRKEVRFLLIHRGASTPSRLEVKKALALYIGRKPEDVYVVRYETKTGTHVSEGLCHVYKDEELARLLLPKHLFLKNLPPEKRKAMEEGEKEKGKVSKVSGTKEGELPKG